MTFDPSHPPPSPRREYAAALEARRELARLFASDEGIDLAVHFARTGNPDYPWSPPQVQKFIADLRDLFERGPVHYVAPEVCQALKDYANLLPNDETLKRQTFLQPRAFIYFATPVIHDTEFGSTRIDRFAIIPWGNGVLVNTYGRASGDGGRSVINVYQSTDWAFGYPIDPGWSPDDDTHMRNRDIRQRLLALALFERQTLTVANHEQVDRHARKRWLKEFKEEPPPIRVVRLRRTIPARPPDPVDLDPERPVIHHRRHWVDPFWRSQWYPSVQEHFQKLVVGHYRGQEPSDDDKPPERVYVVNR